MSSFWKSCRYLDGRTWYFRVRLDVGSELRKKRHIIFIVEGGALDVYVEDGVSELRDDGGDLMRPPGVWLAGEVEHAILINDLTQALAHLAPLQATPCEDLDDTLGRQRGEEHSVEIG